MILLDHIYVFMLVIILPAILLYSDKKDLKRIAQDKPAERAKEYWKIIIWQWLACALVVLIWTSDKRAWHDLGLSLEMTTGFWAGVVFVMICIYLLVKWLQDTKKMAPEALLTIKNSLGELLSMLPNTYKELRVFNGLAVTAGIVEEILWRGYLIWYLGLFMPLWLAAIASIVLFTLVHSYQGIRNLPRVAAMATVLTALYLITESLWLPIILHMAIDLLQGRTLFEVIKRSVNNDKKGELKPD